ncbi:hypothetical protein nbrc107696_12190 [Gordonia spumicola]|uniref:Short-chain dehydrogenase n=1 Tax=Gordonia spumicola TaxID=589161 RepID=A0A7I9V6Q4_9ACTN|nr:SDR family oxidoreductase [Gordonia spumicola]GEE00750.1 hypothetical protein nbrc107696_11960 [Gordonia spumicola]GEE00773.1 hypothetical protein nbrc107696_12190 [Gordonia spumicola]
MNILVIGGSRGVGKAVVLGMSRPGNVIFLNNREVDSAVSEVRATAEELGATVVLVPGDIASPEGANNVADAVRERSDRIDLVVHCAVAGYPVDSLTSTPDQLRHAVEVNALSLVYVVQAVADLLGRGSSIVYLSSRGARVALRDYVTVGGDQGDG